LFTLGSLASFGLKCKTILLLYKNQFEAQAIHINHEIKKKLKVMFVFSSFY